MMEYKVYVIASFTKGLRFHVGFTSDLERRLNEHNAGKTKSTKAYRPWSLFLTETFDSRELARNREKYLKSGSGKEYIKKIWSGSSAG